MTDKVHPALRVSAALKVFPLVDESSRGALEYTVLGLMQETADRIAESLDKLADQDGRDIEEICALEEAAKTARNDGRP